jgi:hypothetical protein
MLFGLLDFGRALYTRQILLNLTREAANLSSRGTSLTNTLTAVTTSAQPLKIAQDGYVILSVVYRRPDNTVIVQNQMKSGGMASTSRVASGGIGSVPTLPATTTPLPSTNKTLYVAEIFYKFTPVTPVGQMLKLTLPTRLYDVAYFSR